MFRLFRYGLIPVVLFCMVIVAASVDSFSTNAIRKSAWARTTVTVIESKDPSQILAEFRGTQNTFPDPRGTVRYVVDGKTYIWRGRGREIGLTVMNPGDRIELYYNPGNPREISTLVLLGASTGTILFAAALAFIAFYLWFFWLRGWGRRSRPYDFDGHGPGSSHPPERLSRQIERASSPLADQHPATPDGNPAGITFSQPRRATFGKR